MVRQVQNVNLEVFQDVQLSKDGSPVNLEATRDQAVDKLVTALESRFTDRVETEEVLQACHLSQLHTWPNKDDPEGKFDVIYYFK